MLIQLKKFNKILQPTRYKKYKFYIDPRIFDHNLKIWALLKQTTQKMYKEIKFAIIKPGLGTIEECLKGVLLFLILRILILSLFIIQKY